MTTDKPQHLKRVLSFWDLMFYGIVIIQPTAPLPSFGIVNSVSRGHAVTAILLAMVAMMLTAISYGRMARAYPNAGSAYTFVGRELHPNLGLLTGWSITLDYVLSPTIGVIWCSKAAMNIVPLPFLFWALFFVIAFAAVNLLGIRTNARSNTVLTIGMFTVLIVFFVAAIAYLCRGGHPGALFSTLPFYNPATFSWPAVRASTSIAVLTYMGFDSVSTLSEDVENPRRNIMLVTVLLCLITGLLGGLEVYFGQLIWPDFHTYPDLDTAFVSVAGRVAGPWMFQLMNFTLLIATVGSSIGAQLGAVRLLYAMGRDDVIPKRFFGVLEPVRNTPRNNILLTAALSLGGALLLTYQLGAELLNYGAFIAFMGVNAASAKRLLQEQERTQAARWARATVPFMGFLICLYIWWSLRPLAKVAGTAWLALGFVYCAFRTGGFKRRLLLISSPEGELMDTAENAASVGDTALIGAVDIGGTKIAVGVLTSSGKVQARRELITAGYPNGAAAAEAITTALKACIGELRAQVCGIGIACTGPIDPATGIIGKVANLPGWEGYGLAGALADHFGVPAVMENDADAAALAEYRWGCGKGSDRFIYVTLSTGIGTGVILDGKLYRGKNGAHPEVGHHTIDLQGPPCYCGANGCWESLASGHAMRNWFLQNTTNAPTMPGFGAREVFALFDRGDSVAQQAVARLSRYVGIGLANLTTIFVPDVIALGGGLTARAETFLPAAEGHFRSICGEVPAQDTRIELAHLQEDIGLAGAGAAWLLPQSQPPGRSITVS